MRHIFTIFALILALLAAGCSSASEAEEATAFLDQWVADWNAGDEDALFGVFLPDGVLVGTGGTELVGAEVEPAWSGYVSTYSLARTGDAVDDGDGSVVFDVEFSRSVGTLPRRLAVTMDGDQLVRLVETYQD